MKFLLSVFIKLAKDLHLLTLYHRQTLEEMTSSKRSESDWQGLVNEVSAALLKHDSDEDDNSCFHMALHRQPPELNKDT